MRPSCHCAIGSPAVAAASSAASWSAIDMPPPAPSRALAIACAASTADWAWTGAALTSAEPKITTERAPRALNVRILLLLALSSRVGQRAVAGWSHELGILPDSARAIFGLARCPVLFAAG